MKFILMFHGTVIFQSDTADLIARLGRAHMLKKFHPESGDLIRTLISTDDLKKTLEDSILLP